MSAPPQAQPIDETMDTDANVESVQQNKASSAEDVSRMSQQQYGLIRHGAAYMYDTAVDEKELNNSVRQMMETVTGQPSDFGITKARQSIQVEHRDGISIISQIPIKTETSDTSSNASALPQDASIVDIIQTAAKFESARQKLEEARFAVRKAEIEYEEASLINSLDTWAHNGIDIFDLDRERGPVYFRLPIGHPWYKQDHALRPRTFQLYGVERVTGMERLWIHLFANHVFLKMDRYSQWTDDMVSGDIIRALADRIVYEGKPEARSSSPASSPAPSSTKE